MIVDESLKRHVFSSLSAQATDDEQFVPDFQSNNCEYLLLLGCLERSRFQVLAVVHTIYAREYFCESFMMGLERWKLVFNVELDIRGVARVIPLHCQLLALI